MGRPRKEISEPQRRELERVNAELAILDRKRDRLIDQRDKAILAAAALGGGQEAIARAAGVTKSRVAQILGARTSPVYKAELARQRYGPRSLEKVYRPSRDRS